MGTLMTRIEQVIADMTRFDQHDQHPNKKSALIRLISVISVPIKL